MHDAMLTIHERGHAGEALASVRLVELAPRSRGDLTVSLRRDIAHRMGKTAGSATLDALLDAARDVPPARVSDLPEFQRAAQAVGRERAEILEAYLSRRGAGGGFERYGKYIEHCLRLLLVRILEQPIDGYPPRFAERLWHERRAFPRTVFGAVHRCVDRDGFSDDLAIEIAERYAETVAGICAYELGNSGDETDVGDDDDGDEDEGIVFIHDDELTDFWAWSTSSGQPIIHDAFAELGRAALAHAERIGADLAV